MQILKLVVSILLALVASAHGPLEGDPMSDAARKVFPTHQHDIVQAFELMPAEKYSFRPTPDLMTFGQLAVHIAGANFYYCRTLSGTPPAVTFPKATAAKEELVKLLRDSFEYCAPVLAGSHDSAFAQTVKTPQGTAMTRAEVLLELIAGMDHHYGQAASYLRLNAIVPPTAQGPAGKNQADVACPAARN